MELQTSSKDVVTFKTKDKVTVKIHGKPNFDLWARKLINLYSYN